MSHRPRSPAPAPHRSRAGGPCAGGGGVCPPAGRAVYRCGLALLLALGVAHTAVAAAPPLELSLEGAVDLALERNPDVAAADLDTRIRERAVEVEDARFGRTAQAGMSHETQRTPSISSLENVSTATSSRVGVDAGVVQNLATGGAVDLRLSGSRVSSNAAYYLIDPVWETQVSLGVTQPLLRGRGDVNRVDEQVAATQLEGARLQAAAQRRDLTAAVATAYWDLAAAVEAHAVQAQLLAGAERVLETARERATAGAGARTEILQAEVGVARRREEVVVAEGQVRQAEDALKALVGLDRDPEMWDVRLRLTTSTAPGAETAVDLRAGVERARRRDPALQRAELQAQALDLLVTQARDQARPQVDLSARVGVSGIGGSLSDNQQALRQADGRSWLGQVRLDVPLGADPAARRLRQRQLEWERGRLDVERRELELVQQVREQYRSVEVSGERAAVAGLAVDLAQQNVAEAEQRQQLGLATVREVLDAQDELATARARRLEAQVEHRQARIEWERLTGAE